jgi:hypothetical protein
MKPDGGVDEFKVFTKHKAGTVKIRNVDAKVIFTNKATY